MINIDSVRYLMREKNNPLNIITIGVTHERYETALCETGCKFYSIPAAKDWNVEYGRVPGNYFRVKELPTHINYDLILCHTSCDRLDAAVALKNYFNIPLIRATHVLPDIRYNIQGQINHFHRYDNEINADMYISKYNSEIWGDQKNNSIVIPHGLDTEYWGCGNGAADRSSSAISVVNLWANRDWACGWNLWNEIIKLGLKYEVCGTNPGLSEPISGKRLVDKYNTHKVFLNTSLHSPVPMALLEAMSCGCVPISTNNCMIPEIIEHGVNGFLADTPEELYNYCQMVFNDDELAKSLSVAARETIKQKFNIKDFINNWNKTFENLLV
jgi:glycosyltransferase involved in cell wall biosynthesis